MTAVSLQTPAAVPCAGGQLRFAPDGRVTVVGTGRPENSAVVPDIALSNFVELWCGQEWACFVGLRGRAVWCAWPPAGKLAHVADLDRLDLRDHYDPGGLHRVEFHELPNGDLLIVFELGLARITPVGNLVWQQVHDQLPARLQHIDADIAWFKGEYEEFGFRLRDGLPFAP